MTITHLESTSLNAYVAVLKESDIALATIQTRTAFLNKLIDHLSDQDKARELYSDALNELITQFDYMDWQHCAQAARDFYPFWMGDNAAIQSIKDSYYFDLQTIHWQPLKITLEKLLKSVDKAVFPEDESELLEQYLKLLKAQKLDKKTVLARTKLAKILLIRLRDAPILNNIVYRQCVDVTLPLFKLSTTRQVFLGVVREFFYIWITDKQSAGEAVDKAA